MGGLGEKLKIYFSKSRATRDTTERKKEKGPPILGSPLGWFSSLRAPFRHGHLSALSLRKSPCARSDIDVASDPIF